MVRSLTNSYPPRTVVQILFDRIADEAGLMAGLDDYDPLSDGVLDPLVDIVAELLMEIDMDGIGPYKIHTLRGIFTSKELVVLEACARRWANSDEWKWDDLLYDRDQDMLSWVFTKNMIKDTASDIKQKLKEYPDLCRMF